MAPGVCYHWRYPELDTNAEHLSPSDLHSEISVPYYLILKWSKTFLNIVSIIFP
jgi:hypothetical protein